MMIIKNDRLLRAMHRQPVDATPIWIMRQAGRYLPEYRKIRAAAGSFLKLCKTPELACEVTLQPLARFPLDAAILFSDILTIPDAMGLGLYFKEGEGPAFEKPLQSAQAIENLAIPDPETDLAYVLTAIRLVQKELAGKVPLIGFCGSPWTVACYAVEGSANKLFPKIFNLQKENPQLLHQLLEKLTVATAKHLAAQIAAGVQAVMLFDTWGGLLDSAGYENFSLNYMKKIIASLKKESNVPIIVFTKTGSQWLELIATSGCDVIGLDWTITLSEAKQRVQSKVALQGNMRPEVLYESETIIAAEVQRILAEYGPSPGHIFNLGHGILRDIDPNKVAYLVDAVHTLSRQYHHE